ncbi:MAG: beta-ureidopropionase [Candidatus Cloacimonetes bacterium]|nr:beta-ureidopropionase [Candidatus Cloacimonadota bacterium]
MKYRVGICQFQPRLLQVTRNLRQLEIMLRGIRADLIVLPELATSGYVFNNQDEVNGIAEDGIAGPTACLLKKLAHDNKTSYIAGFAEKEEDRIYNSAMLVNPSGEIFIYRKTHLFAEEKKWFQPGDTGFHIFSTQKNIKVGIMVCFDWIFPESARSLALQGAQIIAHPANLVLPWCQQAMLTRSLENRVYTITANRTGKESNGRKNLEFTGMSQITNPEGKIIHRMDKIEEGVYIAEIDPDSALDKKVTAWNDILADRRPELYINSSIEDR